MVILRNADTPMKTQESVQVPTSGVVQALEAAWAAIRVAHPEVPAAVIILGPGDERPGFIKWGHFGASRWSTSAGVQHEVLISGESLQRPAAETIGTLLHEAAHGLAHAKRIEDTSRDRRYHNGRFADLARAVGLSVVKDPTYGWNRTSMTPEAIGRYKAVIDALEAAQEKAHRAHRGRVLAIVQGRPGGDPEGAGGDEGDDPEGDKKRQSRISLACSCDEPCIIMGAPGPVRRRTITCSLCGEAFAEREPARTVRATAGAAG